MRAAQYFTKLLLILSAVFTSFSRPDLTFRMLTGCEMLGYPNATLNTCGYCVGLDTGLPEAFGTDCNGTCGGHAVLDCDGVCGGLAFRDECTGACITDGTNGVKWTSRDCRGMCTSSQHTLSGYLFQKDSCGVCRLHSSTGSPFEDCSGKCIVAGLPHKSTVCSQCVAEMEAKTLLDKCGNCKSSHQPCPCDSDPSHCGCRDENNCYVVRALHPTFVPKDMTRTLRLDGYFFPPLSEMQCTFRHERLGHLISTPIRFDGRNRSSVTCDISLSKEGIWAFGLRSEKTSPEFLVSELHVVAYDKDAVSFSSISPSRITTDTASEPLTLKFQPTNPSVIPIRAFQCSMSSIHDEDKNKMTAIGNEPFTCLLKPDADTRQSGEWLISPTFDGGEALGQPLSLQIFAPVPHLSSRKSFISSDGLTIVLTFEKAVDLSGMRPTGLPLCSQVFTFETQQLLNDPGIRFCAWVSKLQLVIYLKTPLQSQDVDIGIKPKVIREDYQRLQEENDDISSFRVSKLNSEWHMFQSRILIAGPSEVPACGPFSLSGHLSTPKSTFATKFEWALKRNDNKALSPELQLLVELSIQEHLILDATLFDSNVVYIFTLSARIDADEVLVTDHKLWKNSYDAPIVSLYSDLMFPAMEPTVDQEKRFWAEVYVPACVHPIQRLVVVWKVTDPRILFNFGMAYSASYFSPPFAVLGDKAATFIVSSFLGHRSSQSSGAGFTVTSAASPLQTTIADGSITATVGDRSGLLLLRSDLSNGNQFLVHQWTCSDSQTHQPCYDYSLLHSERGANQMDFQQEFLLINPTSQMNKSIAVWTNQLQAGKEKLFTLRVMDPNDTTRTSETEVLPVGVVPDSHLQVFVGPIIVNDVVVASDRNPQTMALMVPAYSRVTVRGRVKHDERVTVSWSSRNFQHELHWVSRATFDGWIETEVTFLPEVILPYAVLAVQLQACDTGRNCIEAGTQFAVSQGVSGCRVSASPYVRFDMMSVTIDKCNVAPGQSPLTFRLSAIDVSLQREEPLTAAQFSKVFLLPGPPPFTDSAEQMVFQVEVCDRYLSCQKFSSKEVDVKSAVNLTQTAENLLQLARRHHIAGATTASMGVLSIVMKIPDRDVAMEAINDALTYIISGLESASMHVQHGDGSVILNTLTQALKSTRERKKVCKILSAIEKVTRKFKAYGIVTDTAVQDRLIQTIADLTETANDASILTQSRLTLGAISKAIAASIPIGSRIEFGKEVPADGGLPAAYMLAVHDRELQDITLQTPFNDTYSVKVSISFDSELVSDFSSPWQCESDKSCQSVVAIYRLYPRKGPFCDKTDSRRIGATIEITIHSPESGREQQVSGYISAFSAQISLTDSPEWGGSVFETECQYWDEKSHTWQRDGVHLLWQTAEKVSCWSGHLTAFSVSRVRGSLIGTAIGVSLIVLIFFLLVALIAACITSSGRRKETDVTAGSQQLVSRM